MFLSHSRLCVLISVLILGVSSFGEAMAMNVAPSVVELTTAGSGSRSSIKVINDRATPMPVDISVSRLTLTENGAQQLEPAPGKFLIFPPQAAIGPGASQTFRIEWRGTQNLKESETYVFTVKEVPVALSEKTSGVKLIVSFAVFVNVAPVQAQSKISLEKVGIITDENNVKRAAIKVSNSGNRHGYVSDMIISLLGGSWSATLAPAQLRYKMGLGLVQPGRSRNFILPVEVPGSVSSLQAKLQAPQSQ